MLGLHNRFQAFIHAFRGIVICLTREAHSRFHLCAAAVVIALATFLHASIDDWCWFVMCIGLVLAFEAINTSIERLADRVSEEYHDLIHDAKDLAAGAVLLVSIASVIIGALRICPLVVRVIFH